MTLSKLFDFPFSFSKINRQLDFYGTQIQNTIRSNLFSTKLDGVCLDIGSGTQKYRRVVEDFNLRYLSCDLPGSPNEENQDFLCDASRLTTESNSYDFCLHIQVLEHLQSPQASLNEVNRVLKPGGKLLLATNFLYPIHGEPNDYYRFTKYGLENLIENSGLRLVSIVEIGGFYKFLSTGFQYQRDFFFSSKFMAPKCWLLKVFVTPLRLIINIFSTLTIIVLNQFDKLIFLPKFTSGYFVVANKT